METNLLGQLTECSQRVDCPTVNEIHVHSHENSSFVNHQIHSSHPSHSLQHDCALHPVRLKCRSRVLHL